MKKLILTSLFMPLMTWAHGDDKLGPNKGYVQMPGAFHTEVVLDKDQSVHVYLLDMEFKNPTLKDSSVAVTYKNKKSSVAFNCLPMGGDHFHCTPSQKISIKQGKLVVQATREKAVGNEAIYKLPLKLTGSSNGGHHH